MSSSLMCRDIVSCHDILKRLYKLTINDGNFTDVAYIPLSADPKKNVIINLSDTFIIQCPISLGINGMEYSIISFSNFLSLFFTLIFENNLIEIMIYIKPAKYEAI